VSLPLSLRLQETPGSTSSSYDQSRLCRRQSSGRGLRGRSVGLDLATGDRPASEIITQAEVDDVLKTVGTVLDYLTTAPCTAVSQLKLDSKAVARGPVAGRQVETNGTSSKSTSA
jgi:hypothetical protein